MMHYYAARHVLGREFAYPDGWAAYVFDDRHDRDSWVHECNSEDSRLGHNQCSEAVSRKIARRISGDRVQEGTPITRGDCGYTTDMDIIVGHMLEQYENYCNPRFWR